MHIAEEGDRLAPIGVLGWLSVKVYSERLICDLSISINDMQGGAVQDELLDLCDRLEAAERYGDGQLDWI